jgi:hypothetical protein
MFTVHHFNFGARRSFSDYAEAVAWTRKACFEATIYEGDNRVAAYSPLRGLSEFHTRRFDPTTQVQD